MLDEEKEMVPETARVREKLRKGKLSGKRERKEK